MTRRIAGAVACFAITLAGAGGAQEQTSTCVTCHQEDEAGVPEKVEFGDPGTIGLELAISLPTREWLGSVHAEHDVSCDACHGGDPREEDADLSMSEEAGFLELPAWTEMAEHCGVCHEAIAESWTEGVFGDAMREGQRVPTCATCHMVDGHRIRASLPEELVEMRRCSRCLPVEYGEELVTLLAAVRARAAEIEARVGAAEAGGIELGDVRAELSALRAGHAEAVHAFEPAAIRAASDATLARYQALEALAADYEDRTRARRRIGAGLLAVLALLFAALVGYQRVLRRTDGPDGPGDPR